MPDGTHLPIVHMAGMPNDDGSQPCQRCGVILHRAGIGADPPWYPGQLVAEQDYARASLRYVPAGWAECLPPPDAA